MIWWNKDEDSTETTCCDLHLDIPGVSNNITGTLEQKKTNSWTPVGQAADKKGLFGIHGILLGTHPTCRPVFKGLTFYYVSVVVNASVVVEMRNYSANTPASDSCGADLL